MFSMRVSKHSSDKGPTADPFWISLSDMMISTMTIFLIMAIVTIVVMERHLDILGDNGRSAYERQVEIERFANMIKQESADITPKPKVSTIKDTIRIDLGESVNFMSGSSEISPEGKKFLNQYIPKLLDAARSDLGKKWLKRIVVEGFTDSDGSYLFNLDLSLKRSKQVVCAMFEPTNDKGDRAMSKDDLNMIRDLFLVGGYSFNSMQSSKARSRRVELKLEFWQVDEKEHYKNTHPNLKNKDFGKC
jgi:hypothetical protein